MIVANLQPEPKTNAGETGVYRIPTSFAWRIIIIALTLIGLFIAVNQIFILGFLPPLEFENSYLYGLFACLLSLVFILFPATKGAPRNRVCWYDILLFGSTFIVCSYLASQAFDILHKGWDMVPPFHIGIASSLLCLLVLEALRRTGGKILFIVCVFFAFYPTFADHMPGLLRGGQFDIWNLASYYALGNAGLLGMLARVYGQILIGFLLFGAVLVSAGGAKAFMDFALALFGTQKGGPAKVSIVASGLFGTLSGSIVSNVVTTGSFTIPTMKRTGYPDYFAAAIETCASTGGMIMPPVMGTAGFIMASFLGISYFEVILAAVIPALLFYLGLYMQVHSYAEVHGLRGLNSSQVPSLKKAAREVWPYLFSIFALIYFLYLGLEERAPFIASAVLIALAMIRKRTRLGAKKFYQLCIDTAKIWVMLVGLLVGLGYVISGIAITGLGNSLAHEIGMLARGNVPLLLICGAFGSLVMGTGLTTVACYVLLVIVIAPVLISQGLNPLAVHLFVFYWGLSSNLTPPVAVGAYAAAGVAGSNPIRTGIQSMRLGILMYLLPFAFVLSPALVLQAPITEVILPLATCLLGVSLIAAGLEGYLIKFGRIPTYYRFPLGISGCLLAFPTWQTDVIGMCLSILILIVLSIKRGLADHLKAQ